MVTIKYFIRSEEHEQLYDEPVDRVKLIESGIYKSDLEFDDFVEKLKDKVVSVSNNARIVSYQLEDNCFIEIKLFVRGENSTSTQKQSSRIFKFLNENYDVNLISKDEDSEEFIQIIFGEEDGKLFEKVVKELKKKESIHFNSQFKKTTQHRIWQNTWKNDVDVGVKNFLEFVINVKPESFIEAAKLTRDVIKKNWDLHWPQKVVITNEKLMSSLSKLIGHQISLETHSWHKQKQVRSHDSEENLIAILFTSSYENVVVIIDNNINIIDYKVFATNELHRIRMLFRSSTESKYREVY